jgi:hypothetical protein
MRTWSSAKVRCDADPTSVLTILYVVHVGGQYGSVVLDDCNFHECVHLDEFETARTLHFIPPDGEFSVLNYRVTADFRAPFRIFPTLEETGPYKLELVVLIRADIPEGNSGTNVQVRIPVPRGTAGVTTDLSAEVLLILTVISHCSYCIRCCRCQDAAPNITLQKSASYGQFGSSPEDPS